MSNEAPQPASPMKQAPVRPKITIPSNELEEVKRIGHDGEMTGVVNGEVAATDDKDKEEDNPTEPIRGHFAANQDITPLSNVVKPDAAVFSAGDEVTPFIKRLQDLRQRRMQGPEVALRRSSEARCD